MKIGNFIKGKLGKSKKNKSSDQSDYVDLSGLTEEEKVIIRNTISLNRKTVREIMVPRVDVVMIPLDTRYDKVIKAFSRERNSRIPVYKEDIDDIVGILYVKDLIDMDDNNFSLKKYLHKPYFVPISILLSELLRNFREKQVHIAIVVDEYGGFSGIVSMEDVLEQIVGDIKDEFDESDENIRENDDGSFLFDARVKIETFNTYSTLPFLSDEDADTVGGFLFVHLGRLPKRNEIIEYQDYKFTVVGKSGNIVTKIKVEKKDNSKSSSKENAEDKTNKP